MVLAWEPSFTWNLTFRYENKPTKLQTIPVVPPSFPIKIWGKSVKGVPVLCSYNQANRETDR